MEKKCVFSLTAGRKNDKIDTENTKSQKREAIMKKIISIILAAVLAATALASCAAVQTDENTTASAADLAWLESRLGKVPDGLTVGLGDSLGIDMSDFADDGYMIRSDGAETVIAAKTSDGLDRAVRKYAKAYENGTEYFDEVYHEGLPIKKLTIGGTDISEFVIVPVTPYEEIPTVVSELRKLMKLTCGADLPVAQSGAHSIFLEYKEDERYGETGYTYKVKDGNIHIEGAYELGLYNGVYRFFENELGWTDIVYGYSRPTYFDGTVDVPDGTEKTERPVFDYVYDRHIYEDKFTNIRDQSVQNNHGLVAQATHGLYRFSEECTDEKQPCFTDPYILDEVTENVIEYVKVLIAEGKTRPVTVHIGQSDNNNFCTCKNCLKLIKSEDNAYSGCIITFANALSDRVCEEFPDYNIVFPVFAYTATKKPCITKPRDNIYITFCTDGACYKHSLTDPECDGVALGVTDMPNTDFADYIRTWCGMSDHVYIWHYILDNNFHPLNELFVMYDNLKFYKECGIMGIQPQMDFRRLGFGKVEHSIIEHFNWDGDMTGDEYWKLVLRLMEDEYGEGADYLLEYAKVKQKAVLGAKCDHSWFYGEYFAHNELNWMLFDRDFDYMRSLIEKAVSLADTAIQQQRCELLLVTLYYTECLGCYHHAKETGDEAKLDTLRGYWAEMLSIARKNELPLDPFIGQDSMKLYIDDDLDTMSPKWENDIYSLLAYWK